MMQVQPIGIIHGLFTEPKGAPIQPRAAEGAEGTVVVLEPYAQALRDLDGSERVWLVYWFERATS